MLFQLWVLISCAIWYELGGSPLPPGVPANLRFSALLKRRRLAEEAKLMTDFHATKPTTQSATDSGGWCSNG